MNYKKIYNDFVKDRKAKEQLVIIERIPKFYSNNVIFYTLVLT